MRGDVQLSIHVPADVDSAIRGAVAKAKAKGMASSINKWLLDAIRVKLGNRKEV